MNHNDLDQRLDRAIDALNNEASPAPHEQGDPELFSLVDAARLAKSLREPAEPDADFSALAVARISADLRQSTTTGNAIPPANTPAISTLPESGHDGDNPNTPLPWFRRYAELAAILLVLVLVGGGIYIYQSVWVDDDGTPAIGGPAEEDSTAADETPGIATPDEGDAGDVVTEVGLEGNLCCGVHGVVDGEDYLFVLNVAGSMQVVHVDDRGSLEQVGSLDTPLDIMGQTLTGNTRLAVEDGMLYIPLPGTEQSGLWIVDVSDPVSPVEVTLVETELPPLSVSAGNGLAIVWPMSSEGPLLIFDVSDPARPQLVSEYEHRAATMPPYIEFAGSLLYISSASGVSILDLSDPAEPQEVGTYANPNWEGPSTTGGPGVQVEGEDESLNFADIALMNQYLYVVANDAGLRVLDVSDPANPQEVNQIDLQGRAHSVEATSTTVYVLTADFELSDPFIIETVDISDPGNPQLSDTTTPAESLLPGMLTANDTLYLLDFATIRALDPASQTESPPPAEPTPTPLADAEPTQSPDTAAVDDAIIESFREVQAQVDFDVALPTYLTGFRLPDNGVNTSGPPNAPGVLATFTDNTSQPPRMLALNQRPDGFGAEPDRSDRETEDVVIQGVETVLYSRSTPWQDGQELDVYELRWEMNGISYDLGATNVDRDTFLEIAESITPLSELEGADMPLPEPVDTSAIEDPIDFVLAYREVVAARDMETVRGMFVEHFRQFDGELLRSIARVIPARGDADNSDDWIAEHHADFTVVRLRDIPQIALVLRQEDDGRKIDPGPHMYWTAQRIASGEIGDYSQSSVLVEKEPTAGFDPALIGETLHLVEIVENDVQVSIQWQLFAGAGTIHLDELHWNSGERQGDVEVIWTTAQPTEDSLQLPENMDGTPGYQATLGLINVPDSGDIELHVPMTVVNNEGDDVSFSVIYRFLDEQRPWFEFESDT